MPGGDEHGSEVACLLRQISAEYGSARLGLSGLAHGVSQHRFITQRMERMYELHVQLHAMVGEEAVALIATHLDQAEQGAAEGANQKASFAT